MYLKSPKKITAQPTLLYPEKLSFTIKGKIKAFQDKQKLKESMTTKHYRDT